MGGGDQAMSMGSGGAGPGATHHMGVDHGGLDVGVARQVLDRADVDAAFKEVRGERMPEAEACDPVHIRLLGGVGQATEADGAADLAGDAGKISMICLANHLLVAG